jgi:hypothetical protein
MATKSKTKDITAEELIEVLKFTPRTYRIELGNYGGEVYCGRVDRKVYDYFKSRAIDLDEYNGDWDNELEIPDDMQPFPPGSPYECDDIIHASGATMDDGNYITVFDENGDEVWQHSLDLNALDDSEIPVDEWESFSISEIADGDVVFWGAQGEKGLLYGGEIELNEPFDPKKLELKFANADGWYICNHVTYDGEDIDNNDMSTTGKWGESKWIIGGDEEVYDPEDSYNTPETGPSPDEWEKSVSFKFKKHKPVYVGWYNCVWRNFGTSFGSLYWDGENFVEFNYGKPSIINGVDTWSGYNWDTSDWANRPPEPPSLICDNKKCGWVGKSEERRDDDNYDSHCPDCDGTEFTWIDYDPDSAKGRANRKQYCYVGDTVDLEAALEELKAEFEALCADMPDLINCACTGCAWEGPIDDTLDNDGEMVCPECKSRVEILSEEDEARADINNYDADGKFIGDTK